MGSKGQMQRYAVLKVANYKVCPRILKYYQGVLAVCLHKNLEIINYPNQEELLNTDISVHRGQNMEMFTNQMHLEVKGRDAVSPLESKAWKPTLTHSY